MYQVKLSIRFTHRRLDIVGRLPCSCGQCLRDWNLRKREKEERSKPGEGEGRLQSMVRSEELYLIPRQVVTGGLYILQRGRGHITLQWRFASTYW